MTEPESERVETLRSEFEAVDDEIEPVRTELEAVAADLEPVRKTLSAAETEADLDAVEATLEPVVERFESTTDRVETLRESFDELEVPADESTTDDDESAESDDESAKADDESAETDDGQPAPIPEDTIADLVSTRESLEERIDEVETSVDDVESSIDELDSSIEEQRGPYAEDVVEDVEAAQGSIESTRWTEEGREELRRAVETALTEINAVLDTRLTLADDEALLDRLIDALERTGTAIEGASLDPDEDDEEIATLLDTSEALTEAVEAATAWDDLEIREQLRREGFYDVLDHVKDFPPEYHALKVHEREGNVDMVLLALDSFDSDFMEDHCLEALERMGPAAAVEPMVQRASRRDTKAMTVLGKIGVEDDDVVDTLLEYVDSNPTLQRPAMRALGEIGSDRAVQPIANQLVADEAIVRSTAARALGLIGDTRAIRPLETVLTEDDEDTVRASAAWALNQIGTSEAIDVLAGYTDDRTVLVRAEAERAATALTP